jgi:hypothetical protein
MRNRLIALGRWSKSLNLKPRSMSILNASSVTVDTAIAAETMKGGTSQPAPRIPMKRGSLHCEIPTDNSEVHSGDRPAQFLVDVENAPPPSKRSRTDIRSTWQDKIPHVDWRYTSELKEYCDQRHIIPVYKLLEVYALHLSHDLAYIVGVAPINSTLCNTFHHKPVQVTSTPPRFRVTVTFDGIVASGEDRTKKGARHKASKAAWLALGQPPLTLKSPARRVRSLHGLHGLPMPDLRSLLSQ